MKRLIALFMTVALVLSLAACGAKGTPGAGKDAPASADSYKQAYLGLIEDSEREFGPWTTSESEFPAGGVAFCELFDWDLDGTPELFIGSKDPNAPEDMRGNNVTDLVVYRAVPGGAEKLMHVYPGHAYMDLGADQWIAFLQDADGNLVLRLNQTQNEWSENRFTLYRYDGKSVTETAFYAAAEGEDANGADKPPALTLFTIDEEKVDRKTFKDASLESCKELRIDCFYADYTPLLDFLREKAESYQVRCLNPGKGDNPRPGWAKALQKEYT